jgi:O-antigen ligase
MLLPITYFLGKSSRVSFFPTYLICLCLISLLGSQEVKRFFVANKFGLSLLFSLLAYLALSNLWIDQSFMTSLLYVGYALLVISFVASLSILEQRFNKFFDQFLAILVMSACVSVAYSVYFFHALDYQPLVEPRLYALGGLYNPVVSALSYGVVLILAITNIAINKNLAQRCIYGASVLILIIGIAYSGTRGVWVGLFVSSLILLYTLPTLTKSEKRRIIIIAQLCLVIILAVMYKFGFHEGILQRSTSFRFEIWSEVIASVWSNKLFFGHGLNALELVRYDSFIFEHPHSIYFATLFYGGLFGFGLLIVFLGQFCLSIVKNNLMPYGIYSLCALAFGLTCLLFDGDKILTKINFIWLLIWLPCAIGFMQRSQDLADQSENKPSP